MNLATAEYIEQHIQDDVRKLALQKVPAEVNLRLALSQITARQKLATKVPLWSNNNQLLFPQRLSLEQCSSQLTAQYKQSLVTKGKNMADLTGGMGVDCYFLSQQFEQTTYVEQQEELCQLMEHNSKVLKANIIVKHTNSEEALKELNQLSLIFIDPARRDEKGNKTIRIEDCTPNIIPLWPLLLSKADNVMVKLSPMLDITQILRTLNHIKELHIVSVGNEIKELLLIANPQFNGETTLHCVELDKEKVDMTFTISHSATAEYATLLNTQRFLYEPHVTLLKAGVTNELCDLYNLQKIERDTHLFVSTELHNNFFGRIFSIVTLLPFNKQTIKAFPDEWKKSNVAVRHFPLKADELRKRLHINDGGEQYVFGFTDLNAQHWLALCNRVK